MYEELYGTYPEFQEASMVVDERIKLRWAPFKRKLIQETREEANAKTESRIFGLLQQGYTVEEVKNMLAKERAKEIADA